MASEWQKNGGRRIVLVSADCRSLILLPPFFYLVQQVTDWESSALKHHRGAMADFDCQLCTLPSRSDGRLWVMLEIGECAGCV
jgi:hypothetical protein